MMMSIHEIISNLCIFLWEPMTKMIKKEKANIAIMLLSLV